MRSLFDVNFLIALLDPDHVHSERAHDWWARNRKQGWASCPITENGVVRILSNPNYSASLSLTVGYLASRLRKFADNSDHAFWPDNISLRDDAVFSVERIHGSGQLTDLYLLGLATRNQGRLVTFDQSIPISVVNGAKAKNLCVA
ncbi:MAG: TA system VapC family ribonuclease toxin [Blastocatellia bacterium]